MASIGPTCPVERIDSPCPDRPFQGTIEVKNVSGVVVVRFPTDAQGLFQVQLPPGEYALTPLTTGTFPRAVTTDVTVVQGQFVFVHVRLDSGIR